MAVVVYKRTDKIPVKIGPVKFLISPMSWAQKTEILSLTKMVSGQEIPDNFKMAYLSLKYSIKNIEGAVFSDGSEYKLSFDESGNLTDDSLGELLELPCKAELLQVVTAFLNGIHDPKIKGVEVKLSEVAKGGKS